jgi:hypothetical protein
MSVKARLLKLLSQQFDTEFKSSRLGEIVNSVAITMKKVCGDTLYSEYIADTVKTISVVYNLGVVTATSTSPHGFSTGDTVFIDDTDTIGGYRYITVVDTLTFTFEYTGDLPDETNYSVYTAKKYELEVAETYLAMYDMALLLKRMTDGEPYAHFSNFGEGNISSDNISGLVNTRNLYKQKAIETISGYKTEGEGSGGLYIVSISPPEDTL